MFKTHLLDNKENILGLAIFLSFVVVVLVNIGVLLPQVIQVYAPRAVTKSTLPIDSKTVNKAVEYLE